MSKKAFPYPFKTIATAVAFSPRAEALLYEAKAFVKKFNTKLLLIHVGEKNQDLEQRLDDLLERANIDKESCKVVWRPGKPEKTIIDICDEEGVDLLLLGALRKEKFYAYYLGTVARKISRNANCSVLLLTDPKKETQSFNKVVVNGLDHPKTQVSICTSLYFGKVMKSREITIVEEVPPSKIDIAIEDDLSLSKATRLRQNVRLRENERVKKIIKEADIRDGFDIKQKCIFGKPGYTISHFAEAKKADLLVINSPDKKLGIMDRFFPHDIEYILSDMPTNVFIVRPRQDKTKIK